MSYAPGVIGKSESSCAPSAMALPLTSRAIPPGASLWLPSEERRVDERRSVAIELRHEQITWQARSLPGVFAEMPPVLLENPRCVVAAHDVDRTGGIDRDVVGAVERTCAPM